MNATQVKIVSLSEFSQNIIVIYMYNNNLSLDLITAIFTFFGFRGTPQIFVCKDCPTL